MLSSLFHLVKARSFPKDRIKRQRRGESQVCVYDHRHPPVSDYLHKIFFSLIGYYCLVGLSLFYIQTHMKIWRFCKISLPSDLRFTSANDRLDMTRTKFFY